MAYTIQHSGDEYSTVGVKMHTEESPLVKKKEEDKSVIGRVFAFFFSESEDSYVDELLSSNFVSRALKFFPALLITFGIELGNSAVLGKNQDLLDSHFTLVLFIPVISAIAGNIGLQTSSSVTAYINLRKEKKETVSTSYLLQKYCAHCFVQVIVLALMMGIIATFWVTSDKCHYPYGLCVFSGAFVNMVIASAAGVATPILLNKAGYDPSSGAGPFETALQDVIGAMFFVNFAAWVIGSPWASSLGCQLKPDPIEPTHAPTIAPTDAPNFYFF